MPDPAAHPQARTIQRVALTALVVGIAIMLLKFAVFFLTHSAAVLSDALESIINLVAAGFMLYSIWLSNQPADREHPYGHGKVEFMALGLEGWLILAAGVTIGVVAVKRLIVPVPPERLDVGMWLLGGVNLASGALAAYVYFSGKRHQSPVLLADGKHLATDFASTLGVIIALLVVRFGRSAGWPAWIVDRIDPLIAMVLAALILFTSWRLLWEAINGLMDRTDPQDQAAITAILDEEVQRGAIRGYHKVRHRHTGTFHWVDMHLQVDPALTVRESHELASRIEYRIEQALGQANATAHVEPGE